MSKVSSFRGFHQSTLQGDEDDDPSVKVVDVAGYRRNTLKKVGYIFLCILSLGLLPIFLRFYPKIKITLQKSPCPLSIADTLLIKKADNTYDSVDVMVHKEFSQPAVDYYQANDGVNIVSNSLVEDEIRLIVYRCFRYVFFKNYGEFRRINFNVSLPYPELHKTYNKGLTPQMRSLSRIRFGLNEIDVPVQSIPSLFVNEVLHPFYIFQVLSVTLWMLDEYVVYASTILVTSFISAVSNMLQLRKNAMNLRDMAAIKCKVTVVYQDGTREIVDSHYLVPGDLVEIQEGLTLPCDAVLLNGQCVLNESMLTGESVPVVKSPLPLSEEGTGAYNTDSDTRYTLYSGTTVVQAKGAVVPVNRIDAGFIAPPSNPPIALVVRTGFSTSKGKLVRSILYPKATKLQFYKDSFKFIGVLFIFALAGFAFSIYQFRKLGAHSKDIALRSLDLITIVVPPALPIALTIGVGFAIKRLKEQNIFCISPQRVNEAGKIRMMCFDKTGTLTVDGLDVKGVHGVENRIFTDLLSGKPLPYLPSTLLHTLASCHGLSVLRGDLIGEPLEIKMFEATHWKLADNHEDHPHHGDHLHDSQEVTTVVYPPDKRYALTILKRFQFSSQLQRMSVIVHNSSLKCIEVYVKGAPEIVAQLCNRNTIPENFDELLASYTAGGFRVLALAGITFPNTVTSGDALSMSRDIIESNLNFAGFLVLDNPIKEDTPGVIQMLNDCNIRNVMITGDNVRTAVSVAKSCGIIHPSQFVFLGELGDNPNVGLNSITWKCSTNERLTLDPVTLFPNLPREVPSTYILAVTGGSLNVLKRYREVLNKVLLHASVFARVSPAHKAFLVEEYANLGFCVGFCGDGANDCGALKAARVGLSLSSAEASIAAPFTSKNPSISSVGALIREGRCALVTSFQLFKYMALYSLIQFASVLALYHIGSVLGDWQFLFIDLFIILPLAFGLSLTGAYTRLVKDKPTANLLSRKVLVSLFGQTLIQIGFIVGIFEFLFAQSWYKPFKFPPDSNPKDNVLCVENSTVFLLSIFQYIAVVLAFCINKPFRKPFYTNPVLTFSLISLIGICIYITLYPFKWLQDVLQLEDLPWDFKAYILAFAFANIIASWIYERIIVVWLMHKIKCSSRRKKHGSKM
eukprot:TRINITY_DN2870_c0_g1_i1.p1 TRINITY_DN2870_c0_g1~~TRINITY_DN2870_c0_g1_i1.p1  ORF type:complete len:1135 (-),score=190.03 TRINITY_DN2870_c0_g1_i1:110-3514(-)